MTEPSSPSTGLAVAHLFWAPGPLAERDAALAAIADASADDDDQVVTAAMLGHKAQLCTMHLTTDQWRTRRLQTAMTVAGFELVDSYISLTEISEYAEGVPDEMKQARLYPELPPEGKPAFCFYPMSKSRVIGANWFLEEFERRKEMMYEHGSSGRKFAGRVTQVITGSTGIDDYEWGVTLFCVNPDDLKAVVYALRYDEASAKYAEFGTFYSGMVADPETALTEIGV